MTNKEAIEELKNYHYENGTVPQEIILAIKALEIVDDVNHKIYRNEDCPQKNKCYDYIGCNGNVVPDYKDGWRYE